MQGPQLSPRDAAGRALLSVVVPCFNEEVLIERSYRQMVAALASIPNMDLELVYVDDGSADATLDLLRGLQREDSRVRVLALARNFGQEIALAAGLQHVSGDVVAILDADLQDPPEVVPQMIERWREGADVVYGLRTGRPGETLFKLWSASMFYRVLARVADTPARPNVGNFQVMDRRAADAIAAMPERDRYFRGQAAWAGFRQEAFPYRRHGRIAGASKFNLGKQAHVAANALLSFSFMPVRLAAGLGCVLTGLSAASIVYVAAKGLVSGEWLQAPAGLAIAMVLLGGIQLISLGVVGEVAARTYREVKRRPLYLVKEQLGFPPTGEQDGVALGSRASRPREAAAARARMGRHP